MSNLKFNHKCKKYLFHPLKHVHIFEIKNSEGWFFFLINTLIENVTFTFFFKSVLICHFQKLILSYSRLFLMKWYTHYRCDTALVGCASEPDL